MGGSELRRGDLLTGRVGTYIIKSLIDRGGVGAVYDAQRVSDKMRVALKVLHGGRFPVTEVAKERFRAEIANAMKLKHAWLVEAIDFGQIGDQDFLAMEYVSGGTIAKQVERGKYDDETALRWCAQLLESVRYLHAQGFIHRDLKPNNLLLTASGDLKVGDLGILRDTSAEAYLTLSGDQIGSVLYISRHQREKPAEADIADDAYSISCCMYEILSRRRIHVYPEHLSEVCGERVPVYICDLVMGCLAGREATEAFAELSELLKVRPTGSSSLSEDARRPELNTPIIQLGSSKRNAGIQRKRLAQVAPLRPQAEIKVPDIERKAPFKATYVSEDLILVSPEVMNDGAEVRVQLLQLRGDTLTIVDSMTMISPRVLARDSLGRLVAASSYGIRVFEVGTTATGWLREVAVYRSCGLHGMTIACSRRLPLVAVGSWTDAPVLLNTQTGDCRPLQLNGARTFESGHIAFFGGRKLVLHPANELVVCEIDPEGNDHVVARLPFLPEVLAIEASDRLGVVFVGHFYGLECIALGDGGRKWSFTLETSVGVWDARLSPDESVIAIKCGLSAGRVALIDTETCAMTYLPDSGVRDTLRTARSIDWSPSGATFCVSDGEDFVSVFRRP